MADGNIVRLKTVEKSKSETLRETLQELLAIDPKEDAEELLGEYEHAVLVIQNNDGMRVLPLATISAYHLIGLLEVAKGVMSDSLYYDDEES